MRAEEIIEHLKLEPHPFEKGYFRRTYESDLNIEVKNSSRRLMTSIYYMLTSHNPIGYLTKNTSDIIHFYHAGSPIEYIIISPDGRLEQRILGPDMAGGELFQLVVKGGCWKAARLCSGEYSLISEAVAPGFEYEDNEMADPETIASLFPHLVSYVADYIKP